MQLYSSKWLYFLYEMFFYKIFSNIFTILFACKKNINIIKNTASKIEISIEWMCHNNKIINLFIFDKSSYFIIYYIYFIESIK